MRGVERSKGLDRESSFVIPRRSAKDAEKNDFFESLVHEVRVALRYDGSYGSVAPFGSPPYPLRGRADEYNHNFRASASSLSPSSFSSPHPAFTILTVKKKRSRRLLA